MKDKIADMLKFLNLERDKVIELIEVPATSEHGDYSFPCFSLAKEFKKNPVEIAKETAKKIKIVKGFDKVVSVGPYVNFFVDWRSVANGIVSDVLKKEDKYGSNLSGKGERALIEHTSINPNASPHVGRARNALIGDSFVRLMKFEGYKVETHYFVNDIGKQIAMLVLASEKKKKITFDGLLKMYIEINSEIEKNPELEGKVFDILNKFEAGDKKIINKFKKIVGLCVKGQFAVLSNLGIKYDCVDYESKYLFDKKTEKILEELKKKGKLFEDEEGRIALNQEGYDLPLKSPVLVLTRADKTSLYPLRDIAYTLEKMQKNEKNNFVVLGEDQKTYHMQVSAALDLLGYRAPEGIHYSFILLSEGKMATRKGNVVLLEDFLYEATSRAKVEIEKRHEKVDNKRAKSIAIAAVKYAILKISPDKNVLFDMEESLSFEGNTGPYLLYSYARARSILRKTKVKLGNFEVEKIDEREKELIKKISNFPEIVSESVRERSVNKIANYSYELAQIFNEFYHSTQVIGTKEEKMRLAIVSAFTIVLKNALGILGIDVIERM